jgi:hypothetical protein
MMDSLDSGSSNYPTNNSNSNNTKMSSNNKGNTKNNNKNNNRSNDNKKKKSGTGLNDVFIVFFGIAFLLSLSLNILHSVYGEEQNGPDGSGTGSKMRKTPVGDNSPLYRAMREFKTKGGGGKPLRKRRQEVQSLLRHGGGGGAAAAAAAAAVGQPQSQPQRDDGTAVTKLDTLNCDAYGGGSQEMVYWQDIGSDGSFVSPFAAAKTETSSSSSSSSQSTTRTTSTKYLTFEPDGGGWNNIRMAMESTIGLAIGMGRTLVMPPQKKMYLLGKNDNKQRQHFSFIDFFPIEDAADHNDALNVISMEDYLQKEGMNGKLINKVRT